MVDAIEAITLMKYINIYINIYIYYIQIYNKIVHFNSTKIWMNIVNKMNSKGKNA